MFDSKTSFVQILTHEMMTDVNMFVPCVKYGVFSEFQGTHVIVADHNVYKFVEFQFFQLVQYMDSLAPSERLGFSQ